MSKNRNRQQQQSTFTDRETKPAATAVLDPPANVPPVETGLPFDDDSPEDDNRAAVSDIASAITSPGEVLAGQIESRPAAVLANIRARFDTTTCPKCGAERFWVARTKPTDEGQLRERHCKACGHIGQAIQPPERPV